MATQRGFRSLGFMVSVTVLLLFAATPSWAGVQCGDVIGPDKIAYLKENLTCDVSPAMTVTSNSVLFMNGHTVTCDGTDVGILLDGSGAALKGGLFKNGTVMGCNMAGVEVAGNGHHVVTKVTAKDNGENGFFIVSDANELRNNRSLNNDQYGFAFFSTNGNTLKGNLAQGNGLLSHDGIGFIGGQANNTTLINNRALENRGRSSGTGFFIIGDHNYFRGNLAKNNRDGAGFDLQGSDLKILWNKAIGNNGIAGIGFLLSNGDEFIVVGNTAKKNKVFGIELAGTDSTVVGNVALDNGDGDLVDGNLDCDNNRWKFNWFRTSLTTPPDAGCIR